MSFFIPRERRIRVLEGDFASLNWPARAEISMLLSPAELFGPSEVVSPRAVVVGDIPVTSFWNSNTGEGGFKSDVFLPILSLLRQDIQGIDLKIEGVALTATFMAASESELIKGLNYIEYIIITFLSIAMNTFILIIEITGVLSPNFKFRYQLSQSNFLVCTTNEEDRLNRVNNVLDLLKYDSVRNNRYVIACMYYQNALRLNSPHESRLPGLHFPEMFLNLAKSVEMLFGADHEELRKTCRSLGFSSDDIESQIIPILIIRSSLDIAHPVGSRIPQDFIEMVRTYGIRSIFNVREILLRVGKLLSEGSDIIPPLNDSKKDKRKSLCNKIREHLQKPPLSGSNLMAPGDSHSPLSKDAD